jgi:hypothetical protein
VRNANLGVGPDEWRERCRELVEDDAQPVNIGGGGRGVARNLLGGDIRRGPGAGASPGQRNIARRACEAEVEQRRASLPDQDVLRRHISVHDAAGVEAVERVGDRGRERDELCHADGCVDHPSAERGCLDQLDREEVGSSGAADLEESRNACRVDAGEDLRLALEARDRARIVVCDLQRDQFRSAARSVDRAEAAARNALEDVVAADLGGGDISVGRRLVPLPTTGVRDAPRAAPAGRAP